MAEEPLGIEFLSGAWDALRDGDVAGALRHVGEAYGHIGRWCDGGQRLPIGWPEADRVIAAAARLVRPASAGGAAKPELERSDAILISRWTNYGGHRFAATDLLRASPARRKYAFVINPGSTLPSTEKIAGRLGIPEGNVEIAPEEIRGRPWEWLPSKIDALGCSRLFIVHETYRPGVLVAALASSCAGLYILHHIDSKPCSGLFLPGVRVIDWTPYCFHYSRRNLAIDPIYLPLVSEAPAGERPPFLANGELRTATCGREEKFDTARGFPYAGIVAERLCRFGGVHLHIGHLSDASLGRIETELRRCHVDRARFEYLSRVPNLPSAIWTHGVDVYLASFPFGGARTIVDVMASATPMVVNARGEHERQFSAGLRAPGTEAWSNPEQLWTILDSVTPEWLATRSRLARDHFEKNHSRRILAEALMPSDIRGVEPPRLDPDVVIPSPQNAICQIIADVAWLRKSERDTRERLAALEQAVSRSVQWPHWMKRH